MIALSLDINKDHLNLMKTMKILKHDKPYIVIKKKRTIDINLFILISITKVLLVIQMQEGFHKKSFLQTIYLHVSAFTHYQTLSRSI